MSKHPEEFTDTDPRAMAVWLDLLRKKSPGERLTLALQLSEFTIEMGQAGGRHLHPEADEREVRLRFAARYLPRELMIRAYGWDPESDGLPG